MFKIGQKIVCKGTLKGVATNGTPYLNYPKKDEIVTVCGFGKDNTYLLIDEYSYERKPFKHYYMDWHFEPLKLDYNFVDEVLKQVKPKKQLA